MIAIIISFFLIFLLCFFPIKEGFEDEEMTHIIKRLTKAKNDVRMTSYQKIALDNALKYAVFIKKL